MPTSRREFLRSIVGGSTLLSLSPAWPWFLQRTAAAMAGAEPQSDTVLVVLQLSGGNDGLNTVVPYTDDAYGRGRQTLRLTADVVHKIDAQLGLHPAMRKAWQLYQEGRLGFLQGVGYPNSHRGHDEALRDWHTAQPGAVTCQTGWLGRAIDEACSGNSLGVPGVCVAPIPRPFALNAARAVVPTISSLRQFTLQGAANAAPRAEPRGATDNPLLQLARQGAAAAYASSRKVEAVLQDASPRAEYPSLPLAEQFKTIAEFVRADVGVRIYFSELGGGGIGGFDNHANQRDNHAALLRELSESVAAFVADLARDRLLDRVLLVTFSEFGRTLSENGRRGTDHGAAQPLLVAGGRFRGGLIGAHPSLTDLDQDAPKLHTDFRRVYATLLERWLGFRSQPVLGGPFEVVDFLT